MRIIIASLWILSIAFKGCSAQEEEVTGLIGKAVTLPCGVSHSGRVKWVDWVYNEGRDPRDLYDSDSGIAADHPNAANFEVDPSDYSLIISNLKLAGEDNPLIIGDAGEYICVNVDSGDEAGVQLYTAGKPKCSGNTDLKEGDSTKLTCSVDFSGSTLIQLNWYLGDVKQNSTDMNNIGLAQQDLSIKSATWDMNGKPLQCRMKLGEHEEQCGLDMTVQYMVRDLELTPAEEQMRVGETITCSARGNPQPRIEITVDPEVDLPQVQQTENTRFFDIPKKWEGKQVKVQCAASNTFDGNVENMSTENTYDILEPAKSTEAPDVPPPAAASTNIAGIIAAVVIVALVVVVIVIAVVCIKRKSSNKPKGAKPVPTKEEEVRALEQGKA